MILYEDELNRFLNFLCKDGYEETWEDIQKYFFEVERTKLTIRGWKVHQALRHCKSFEQISEEFTQREGKRVSTDAVRKRAERALKTIKKFLMEKYGNQ
jgi:hypothetical protein